MKVLRDRSNNRFAILQQLTVFPGLRAAATSWFSFARGYQVLARDGISHYRGISFRLSFSILNELT